MEYHTRKLWRHLSVVVLMCVILLATLQAASYADADADAPPTLPPGKGDSRPYVPPLQPPPRSANRLTTSFAPANSIPRFILDMRVLVIDDGAPDGLGIYNTAVAYLDILGVPYDTINTSLEGAEGALEADDLWDGQNHGYYYAVFVTTSNVWWGLSAAEQTVLETYMRDFGVRQVTWYAWPSPTPYGLSLADYVVDGCVTPTVPLFEATMTEEAAELFHYLRSDGGLPISGYCLYGYTATPAVGADVTPLLLDDQGNAFLALYRPGDGREHLVMTLGSYYPALPPGYIHARLLPYGVINWATRGIFLGERHLYFTPQPDDVLSWGDAWDVTTHWYIFDNGFRNTPADLENLVAWQNHFRANTPNAADFRVEMPFNGDGAEEDMDNGAVVPGTLTAKAVELADHFTWLNHTYSHLDLDVNETPYPGYAISHAEIYSNTLMAAFLGFTDYATKTLLTGDYSGLAGTDPVTGPYLANPDLAQAAHDLGVRFMQVNASYPEYNNPTPNTGIPHPTNPEILLVPRYANNIYYAVTTPEQETDLYNIFYCPTYPGSGYTAPCFTYDEIMESITNQALSFLLDFSVNATMFHMNNFGMYDANGRSLMTDFIEQLYSKYNTFYNGNTPILSPRTQEIGALMQQRMAYNASGVTGQLSCGSELTFHTQEAAVIPVTGISFGDRVEIYSGQPISYLAIAQGETLVVPGETARIPAGISDLSISRNNNQIELTWSATTQDTEGNPLTAVAYRIYARANDPYFTPTPADLLAEVSDPGYIHLNGVGDAANNYTYVVTAVGNNCWQRESAPSNRVGEFDYTLSETADTDFNWIALPLDAGLTLASDLAAHIEANSSGPVQISVIEQWMPVSQSYHTFIAADPPFGDFALRVGGAYRLSVVVPGEATAVTWTLVGRLPEPAAFTYSLHQTNDSSFNWLMLPLQKGSLTLASLLQENIQASATPTTTVYTVEMWNAAGQNYQQFIAQPGPSGDFSTRIGYPYRVSVSVETEDVSTWP